MKRLIITLCVVVAGIVAASAQKYALIDMEYILKNIPSYEMANEQLNQVAKRWQKECDDLASEAEVLYKNYLADMVFLTDEMKTQRADEVKAKEQRVSCVYFRETHSRRHIQCCQKAIGRERIYDGYRPSIVKQHHFCIAQGRY